MPQTTAQAIVNCFIIREEQAVVLCGLQCCKRQLKQLQMVPSFVKRKRWFSVGCNAANDSSSMRQRAKRDRNVSDCAWEALR
eukprot:4993477-Prorocentrum_lima.AAC.1